MAVAAGAAGAEVLAEVVGFVASVLGIVQFSQDSMPNTPSSPGDNSFLRVALGQDSVNLTAGGGEIGNIKVYSEMQGIVGAGSGNGHISEGNFQDITINQRYGPGKQPTYVQINSADDGVCIAYLLQTWPDGKQRGWLGDVGYMCGADCTYIFEILLSHLHISYRDYQRLSWK